MTLGQEDDAFAAWGSIEEAIKAAYWSNVDGDEYNMHLFTKHHWGWDDYYALVIMDMKADWHRAEHENGHDEDSEWEDHAHE